jgi:succinyl-CoA synthetase beta subunit/citryl-CoA synthetase large subunit
MARLLENHAKDILQSFGVQTPNGTTIRTRDEVARALSDLTPPVVVKALIPTGRRGKAGAVLMAETESLVYRAVEQLLGKQVGEFTVEALWIEEKVPIQKELYVAITYDTLARSPVLLFSSYGGVDVEELMARHPDRLHRQKISILEGLHAFQARRICSSAGLDNDEMSVVAPTLLKLYDAFFQKDLRLLEINPLAMLAGGDVCVVGALVNMDDEALFRHPEFSDIVQYAQDRSLGHLTEREQNIADIALATQSGSLRYTELDGDIAFGIVGGGASLVSMDAIIRRNGKPANYADLGPGKGVDERLRILLKTVASKPGVRGLVTGANIAAAIDVGEMGRIVGEVLEELEIDPRDFPVVARWAGFGEEKAQTYLQAIPGLHAYGSEISIEDAAEKIVALVKARDAEQGVIE